ncbi:VanZ family protein [Aquimarina sp. 2201CG5-10]|uniref:VanZ family protein n=1 Tax=Aquimarina callyspongiae TaxID=3098150 RepID=UPI002AB3FB81|nr:VanZ family protein [Aquimarina sp. 2201CG5-10]MDY8136703.1 VanZ family protein [Aquimarina sp. 2201CG5-10]
MIIKILLGHRYLLTQVIGYTSLIAWVSLAKIDTYSINFNLSDKIAHLLAYFIFTIVWFMFFFFSKKRNKNFGKSLWYASVIGFLFGLLMEVLQALLTSYRSSEWFDALANTTGIIFAAFLLKLVENKIIRVKEKL